MQQPYAVHAAACEVVAPSAAAALNARPMLPARRKRAPAAQAGVRDAEQGVVDVEYRDGSRRYGNDCEGEAALKFSQGSDFDVLDCAVTVHSFLSCGARERLYGQTASTCSLGDIVVEEKTQERRPRQSARPTASRSARPEKGFARNATASACSALDRESTSSCAVMNITGF